MKSIEQVMRLAPVIPVLVIEDVAHAVPVAEALVRGGLPVLEVTLRTAAALDVIRAMKTVPGALVGAGTVLNEYALDDALSAGSEFIVSPGLTKPLAARPKRPRCRSCPVLPRRRTSCAVSTLGLTASSSSRPKPMAGSRRSRRFRPRSVRSGSARLAGSRLPLRLTGSRSIPSCAAAARGSSAKVSPTLRLSRPRPGRLLH